MKVLFLINNDGGLYNFRRELLEKLLADGNEVVTSFPDGEYRKDVEQLGCKYYETNIDRRGVNPIKDLGLLFKYVSILRKEKPNIVLTYTVKPNVYGGIACQLTNNPYISTVTGLGTPLENPGILRKLVTLLYKTGLKKAKVVVFQNETNKARFEELNICHNSIVVSGSGVNLSMHKFEEYPSKDANIRLMFVGRIMKDKGVTELLEAAKYIKKKYPNVCFDVVGSFEESYHSVIEQYVKDDIINYLGSHKDVHKFYKEAWALVLPTYHEGISNVCLESASTGRPVIASKIPGCLETFDDGITGIGFEAKNIESLKNAIEKFINLPYEAKVTMGMAGRKKMEQLFDRKKVVQEYMSQILEARK